MNTAICIKNIRYIQVSKLALSSASFDGITAVNRLLHLIWNEICLPLCILGSKIGCEDFSTPLFLPSFRFRARQTPISRRKNLIDDEKWVKGTGVCVCVCVCVCVRACVIGFLARLAPRREFPFRSV